jgi:TetR/AcrR family transcriptional regulator
MSETATDQIILDAAEQLFAAQGFPGTTVKQIAARAKVNPALLYYYFADKEGLYGAVLERLVERIVAMGTAALGSSADPEAALRAIIAAQARLLSDSTWTHILVRELLDAEHSRIGEPARRIASTVFAQLCTTIRKGQETGAFRRDMDARFAAISLVGQQIYFNLAKPAVSVMLEREGALLTDAVRSDFADHVAEFCLTALRAEPQGSPA